MRLSTFTRATAVKAATLVATATLLVTGCGSNNSDDSNTNHSKSTAVSTKPEPKLEYTALTAWTVDTDDPYVEHRVIMVWNNNCFLETRSTSSTRGDIYPPSPMNNCVEPTE